MDLVPPEPYPGPPRKVVLLGLPLNGTSDPADLTAVYPAIKAAINRVSDVLDYVPDFNYTRSTCSVRQALGATHELVVKYYQLGLPVVFLGTTCTEDYIASSSLFSYFGMGAPITPGCHYTSALYNGLRISYNQDTIFSVFSQLCLKFGWININVITDTADSTDQFKWTKLSKGNSKWEIAVVTAQTARMVIAKAFTA
ncbi:hypothetical protein RvY_16200 [Ramazzottius varieornatus]|uniref:Uncharacterized protein n=1 Tax=Ramazzottius varieornatus TaxID=947166 RepID=A0A1D1W0K6_RAMVA|nr:hypothetical protein RvY_16200 [Ramazzottius varieornatus]